MINLYYSEAYWGHSATMNGPHKVVDNLVKSLDQEKIDYAINQEKYKHNFLLQYDWTGHVKHSELDLENVTSRSSMLKNTSPHLSSQYGIEVAGTRYASPWSNHSLISQAIIGTPIDIIS